MRKFITDADLGRWIDSNFEDMNTYNEVMDAVYWFVACWEADDVSSNYGLKDIANILLNGTEQIKGNLQYVRNFLDNLYEDCNEEDIEEVNNNIIERLESHFGI